MRIVFINRFFDKSYPATAKMLFNCIMNIDRKKNKIVVISSSDLSEIISDIKFHKIFQINKDSKNIIIKLLNYLIFYISIFLYSLFIFERKDKVVIKTDPPFLFYILFMPFFFKKIKIYNWLQDLYPEIVNIVGIINNNNFLYKALILLRNIQLKYSFCNIVISEDMEKYLIDEHNITNIKLIENSYDADIVSNFAKNQNNTIDNSSKFKILYSGNLGRLHDFKIILELAKDFQNQDVDSFELIIVGNGYKLNTIKKYIYENNLKNIKLLPFLSAKEIANLIVNVDLNLITTIDNSSHLFAPSKFYTIIESCMPILFIGDQNSFISKRILKYSLGFSISNNNYSSLNNLISELIISRKKLFEIKKNIKSFNNNSPINPFVEWDNILKK